MEDVKQGLLLSRCAALPCVCIETCRLVCVCVFLTVGLGQVLVKLLPVVLVKNVVHAGVDELLLFVLQVLRHVVRHEHDAALPVYHEQEAIQSLEQSGRKLPMARWPIVSIDKKHVIDRGGELGSPAAEVDPGGPCR